MRFFPTSLALVALTSAATLFGCSDTPPSDNDDDGGSPGNGGSGANSGGVGAGSGAPAGGASSGSSSGGGSGVSTGGVGASSGSPSGGAPTGGSAGSGDVGGSAPQGGDGGSGNTSGSSTGGASGGSGGGAGGSPNVDKGGKMNAVPGAMTSTPQDYLRLGEIRLLNNNWGSEDLGCNAPMSVFVNADRSFGWRFNRGDCDTANSNQKPDFPQVEFGIHPFGVGNALATSPDFSSTTLLPLQIKDITSASVNIQGLNIQLTRGGSWNITFEFWLSTQNPNTAGNAGVHTELMTFWGWQANRWPTAPGADGAADGGSIGAAGGDLVTSGSKSYRLWVQRDMWADGWRYYQFRDSAGSGMAFNGNVNVKQLLDYLVNTRQFSRDLWVTRLEVGSEIDDLTEGTVTMQNITFEVNGQSRSPVFGP